MRLLAAAAVLLVAACASVPPADDQAGRDEGEDGGALHPPIDFRTVSEFSKLAPGGDLVVDNPWGDVRFRRHDIGAVEVVAAVQRIGARPPPPPDVQLLRDGTTTTVRVAFPGANLAPRRNGRVDLAVYVPDGVPIRAVTRDGLIEAKKTANPLMLETGSGDIVVINDGAIEARTDSGRIFARPMYPGWGRADLESGHGDVSVFVPVPSSFRLVATGTDDVAGEWPVTRHGDEYRIDATETGEEADRIWLSSSAMIRIYRSAVEPGAAIER